jgi:hypothetical protein
MFMQGYHRRAGRIPVRGQRAHQPGQVLALGRPLAVFYLLRAVLGQLAKSAWFAGAAGVGVHYILALGRLCAHDLGFRRNRPPATTGRTHMDLTRSCRPSGGVKQHLPKTKKARWPSGHRADLQSRICYVPTRPSLGYGPIAQIIVACPSMLAST